MTGIVRVGRLSLTEHDLRPISESKAEGFRVLAVNGKETVRSLTTAQIRALAADVVNSEGLMVPVKFADKPEWNGYYIVGSTKTNYESWLNNGSTLEWEMALSRLGSPNDVDIESVLTNTVNLNDFSSAGERWHAPPIGATAYWTGGTQPSQVARVGTEGTVVVYRNLPINTDPRYSVSVDNYQLGRCRFIDSNGIERTGIGFDLMPDGWSISNSLVRLTANANGNFDFGTGDFSTNTWPINVRRSNANVTTRISSSVLRNDYEMVVVRVLYNIASGGRITADFSLRRGSRFVEVYVKSNITGQLGLASNATIPSTSGTGFQRQTTAQGGMNLVIGSGRNYTVNTATTGVEKSATTFLDAFVGLQDGNGSPAAGNAAADLFAQYIGAPAERVNGVLL